MPYKKKTSSRKSSSRKTTKKKSTALTSAQKKLKERQTAPWDVIRSLHVDDPVVYNIPWGNYDVVRSMDAHNVPGLGYVTDGLSFNAEDYVVPHYSWEEYCAFRARHTPAETPFPTGRNPGVYTLRKDQKEDLLSVIKQHEKGAPEFLIANSTGTGKTVTTWKAAQVIRPGSVLIVCPSAVIPSWRQHIMDMGDMGMRVVIINYESLKKLIAPPDRAVQAKKTETQNKYIALEGKPYTMFDIVIFDEAHKLRNPTSQQSRIANTLANGAKFVMRLTATPGKDPSQLHHLHRGLSWVTGDYVTVDHKEENNFSSYVSWCRRHGITHMMKAPFGNGIKWDGPEKELNTMSSIMYSPQSEGKLLGIKRKPEQWGDTIRNPLPLELSHDDMVAYSVIVEDTKNEILKGSSKGRLDTSRGLAAMVALRQKTGMLKAEYIVDYIQHCLQDLEEQVVVSAIYKKTVETLSELLNRKKINHVVITGELSPEEKEHNRVAFQRGEVKVVITSVTTGISLHAGEDSTSATETPRHMIIADAHYSPIEHTQLEGRINRNGKTGVVTVPFIANTIDESVTKTLLKGLTSQSILQGTGEEDDLKFLASCFGIQV